MIRLFEKPCRWKNFMRLLLGTQHSPLPPPDKAVQRDIERLDLQARYIAKIGRIG